LPELIVHLAQQRQVVFFEGQPLLSDLLREKGFPVMTPCGGAGVCGRCAVRAAGSLSPAPRDGLARACSTRLLGDAQVWLQEAQQMFGITLAPASDLTGQSPMQGETGLAVDIGTTTIAALLVDLKTGRQLATAACLNPQVQVADNVIGRIAAALSGQSQALQDMVQGAVRQLKQQLAREAGIPEGSIRPMVITGNTAMLHLYQGLSPKALSAAPFMAEHLFGEWSGEGSFLPRCIAAFLGADLLMAILVSGMCDSPDTALLADIGTNGEIALWHEGQLYCAAAAAGPAFEGGGIHMGSGSVKGAIDSVRAREGKLQVTTIGGAVAASICGSGIIDAASAFLDLGLMDETGRLARDPVYLTEEVFISQEDIRKLQLAKGAVAAAMGALCETAGVTFQDIRRFYLAGGFGAHMGIKSAARIGLIPAGLTDKTLPLGNAALSGAARIMMDQNLVQQSARLAESARVVTLSGSPLFSRLFTERMFFEEF